MRIKAAVFSLPKPSPPHAYLPRRCSRLPPVPPPFPPPPPPPQPRPAPPASARHVRCVPAAPALRRRGAAQGRAAFPHPRARKEEVPAGGVPGGRCEAGTCPRSGARAQSRWHGSSSAGNGAEGSRGAGRAAGRTAVGAGAAAGAALSVSFPPRREGSVVTAGKPRRKTGFHYLQTVFFFSLLLLSFMRWREKRGLCACI